MKLFSRKALVAAATAATVSLSGVTVANAETTPPEATTPAAPSTTTPAAPSTTKPADETTTTPSKTDEDSSSSSSDDSKGSSISDMDPKEIRDWIAVFTAIIGALGTAFAFYNKNLAPNAK